MPIRNITDDKLEIIAEAYITGNLNLTEKALQELIAYCANPAHTAHTNIGEAIRKTDNPPKGSPGYRPAQAILLSMIQNIKLEIFKDWHKAVTQAQDANTQHEVSIDTLKRHHRAAWNQLLRAVQTQEPSVDRADQTAQADFISSFAGSASGMIINYLVDTQKVEPIKAQAIVRQFSAALQTESIQATLSQSLTTEDLASSEQPAMRLDEAAPIALAQLVIIKEQAKELQIRVMSNLATAFAQAIGKLTGNVNERSPFKKFALGTRKLFNGHGSQKAALLRELKDHQQKFENAFKEAGKHSENPEKYLQMITDANQKAHTALMSAQRKFGEKELFSPLEAPEDFAQADAEEEARLAARTKRIRASLQGGGAEKTSGGAAASSSAPMRRNSSGSGSALFGQHAGSAAAAAAALAAEHRPANRADLLERLVNDFGVDTYQRALGESSDDATANIVVNTLQLLNDNFSEQLVGNSPAQKILESDNPTHSYQQLGPDEKREILSTILQNAQQIQWVLPPEFDAK